MSERVLVTGGAGFIGSHLTDLLLEQGYQVRVLDNLSMGNLDWLSAQVDFMQGDICDLETCRRAAKDCAGVFHMAAMSRSAASLDNIDICTTNNIIGTQNILAASKAAGVRKLIYSGSSTYYGSGAPPQKEDMLPDFLNFYGLSKYVGEEYCRLYDRLYGLPVTVLRYFNVYGPRLSGIGAYALVLSIFLEQKRSGQSLTIHGSGEQRRDFIHVRDVARANLAAYQSDVHGQVYNVGTGDTISIKEVANLISEKQLHEERRKGDAEITQADISRIKADLGWSPEISFAEGIKELL